MTAKIYCACFRKHEMHAPQDLQNPPGGGGGEGRESNINRGGMLVVSLRGVNFGFWFHLRCSGQNAIIFRREGLL